MPQNTISTYLRCRPCKRPSGFFELGEDSVVQVEVPKETVGGTQRIIRRFGFNGLIGTEATQDEVFETVARPVVNSVIEGFNGTVFAYGQTGSGKTFTLTGGVSSYNERGIIPRALSVLYAHIDGQSEMEYTVRISSLELYNESGFDLLDSRQSSAGAYGGGGGELGRVSAVTEDEHGEVTLRGLSSHVASTEEEALNLLFVGDTNRAVAETTMNATSSRSHCVFTASLESRPVGAPTLRRSKLHLVDLAGSERVSKTGASGTLKGCPSCWCHAPRLVPCRTACCRTVGATACCPGSLEHRALGPAAACGTASSLRQGAVNPCCAILAAPSSCHPPLQARAATRSTKRYASTPRSTSWRWSSWRCRS
jgi:kinesin family protein 6/9